jgi:chromosome segregation ATPase
MFEEFDTYSGHTWQEDRLAKLERLAEIRDDLQDLVKARDRLVKELTRMREKLEDHRRSSTELRTRATQLLGRLIERAENEDTDAQTLSPEDERTLEEIDVSRRQLEREVEETDRRLRIAQFEADTLAASLEDLEEQVAELAEDLNIQEGDDYLTERH